MAVDWDDGPMTVLVFLSSGDAWLPDPSVWSEPWYSGGGGGGFMMIWLAAEVQAETTPSETKVCTVRNLLAGSVLATKSSVKVLRRCLAFA